MIQGHFLMGPRVQLQGKQSSELTAKGRAVDRSAEGTAEVAEDLRSPSPLGTTVRQSSEANRLPKKGRRRPLLKRKGVPSPGGQKNGDDEISEIIVTIKLKINTTNGF